LTEGNRFRAPQGKQTPFLQGGKRGSNHLRWHEERHAEQEGGAKKSFRFRIAAKGEKTSAAFGHQRNSPTNLGKSPPEEGTARNKEPLPKRWELVSGRVTTVNGREKR